MEKLQLQKRDLILINLARAMFPHIFSQPFSRMQVEWIQGFFKTRTCFEAPPLFGKTMTISFLKSIYSALGLIDLLEQIDLTDVKMEGDDYLNFLTDKIKTFYTDFRGREIFVASETGTKAEDILRDIKLEFEGNKLLGGIFANQIGDRWSTDHIILSNNSQIIAKGWDYQFRNYHPDEMVLDDVQTDENATREQFDKDWNRFMRTILSRKAKKLHIIGNRLTDHSIVARITDNYHGRFQNWHTKKFKALDEDGKSAWASGMPQAELDELKLNMGATLFAIEYLGQTNADKDIEAIRSRLRFYKALPTDTHFMTIMAVDPAFTKDEYKVSSSTGIAIFNVAMRGAFKDRVFLTRIERQKLLLPGVVDWMVNLHKQYFFSYIGIEDTTSNKGVKELFLNKIEQQRIPIELTSVIGLPATKSKQARLRDVMGLIEGGAILFDETSPVQKEFIETELLPQGSDQNDRLDAFVHGLTIVKNHLRPEAENIYFGGESQAINEPEFENGFCIGMKPARLVRTNSYISPTEEENA